MRKHSVRCPAASPPSNAKKRHTTNKQSVSGPTPSSFPLTKALSEHIAVIKLRLPRAILSRNSDGRRIKNLPSALHHFAFSEQSLAGFVQQIYHVNHFGRVIAHIKINVRSAARLKLVGHANAIL